ncbi:MAG: hypothetical protein ABII07_04655 [Patescibacteria group bacterium]|nr:hypothetical protein [Patescibacteria group bacterium]
MHKISLKDKIYMTGYGEGQVSGTEIYNPILAQSQRALFELLWESI